MFENIDNIDRRILYELDKNCRAPETQIAKKLRVSREVVHYRIKNLEKQKIVLGYTCFINVGKLGYQGYKIYLKIKGKPERKKEFSEDLKTRKDIFWFGAADGAWDIGLTFFAKDNVDFHTEMTKLFSKYSDLILQRYTGSLVEPIIFGRKLLLEKQEPEIPAVHMFGRVEENKIDEIDKKILRTLMKDSKKKLMQLAKETKTSVDVVRNRMKKLEAKGILVKYLAVIDYNKIGIEFYKTFLYFDTLSPKDEKKLYEFCKGHPNIIHMVRQITPWDVEIEVMVENYPKYNAILHKIKELFSDNLRNIESAIMGEDYLFPSREKIFS